MGIPDTLTFQQGYRQLGEAFFELCDPEPVDNAELFLWNRALAEDLQLSGVLPGDAKALANIFSGNEQLPGSRPIALAYAGHQFGNFVPQLGDGRAHLLAQWNGPGDQAVDIQLKGSGRTPFSRGGDGRCAFGPALREFIMSEAMHALRVPTTRALAVVTTGEEVLRQGPGPHVVPGAIVARVAASHLRVGTFQFYAARGDVEALRKLTDYAIERHYPQLLSVDASPERYLRFFEAVIDRQIDLIVHWLRVGFIHGVMNTDNTSIAGETIDYGPCAMLGIYHPQTRFSSIDSQGRYAFGNQAPITQWNMLRLAECLLPLIDEDGERAVAAVSPLISDFSQKFDRRYYAMLANKMGFETATPEVNQLGKDLLDHLQREKRDYTLSFVALMNACDAETQGAVGASSPEDWFTKAWFAQWQRLLAEHGIAPAAALQVMRKHNPQVIPRNHHVEAVLEACAQTGSARAAEEFLSVLRNPYQTTAASARFQRPPEDNDRHYRTYCGT